jgi:CubicO group peptidase (beta-lactamase class C family)
MRPLRIFIAGFAVLLIGGVISASAYLASVARSGTGYEAQTMCSAVFISGRAPESVRAAEFQGLHPLLKSVSLTIERRKHEVRANLFGLGAQKSSFREGLGCTLTDIGSKLPPAPAVLGTRRTPPDDDIARGVRNLPHEIDPVRLAAAVDRAFEETDAANPLQTRALLVLLDGHPIAERYAPGFNKDMPLAGYSMTKTVMSALTGILIERGRLRLDQTGLMPEWRATGDARGRIAVDNLLHMTSGLNWDEDSHNPRGDALLMAFHDRDTSALAASRPLVHMPGTMVNYNSGAANILSRVLRDTFAGDIDAYLAFPRTAIFDRIGMSTAMIAPDGSGVLFGSTQGFATARDWARFGELYRNDGRWNGEQILPSGWVSYSVRPQAATGGADYGAMIRLNRGAPGRPSERPYPLLPEDTLMMHGQFSQVAVIIPSRRLIIVRLGETHSDVAAARLDRAFGEIMDAGAPRAAESASISPPFSARCRDVGANGGAVDAVVAAVRHDLGQRDRYGLPDLGLAPAPKPQVDCVPVAVFGRSIAPWRAAAKTPEGTVKANAPPFPYVVTRELASK